MLFAKNHIMLLLVAYTPIILGMTISINGSLRHTQDRDNLDVQIPRIVAEDPCESFDCQNNGSCYVFAKNPACVCQAGYSGLHCEERPEDPCEFILCQNGGSCFLKAGKAACICPYKYRGELCERIAEFLLCEEDSECDYRQKCLGDGKGKSCECADGLSGLNCDTLDWCVTGKFQNCTGEYGTCRYVEEKRSVDCICPFGKVLDPDEYVCKACDCGPKGFCRFENGQQECKCEAGFILKDGMCTEMDPCKNMPCQNEGICIEEGNSFNCYCKPPYHGAFCEKEPCTENPCQNGGTCVQTDYSFMCRCRFPYSGDTCQYVDVCNDNPCVNGGTCEKYGDFFKCKCRYGYYGSVCEKEGFESTPDTTTELENTSISTLKDERNYTVENYTVSTHELTKFTLNFNLTTVKPEICTGDTDCLHGGICRNSYCECLTNFGGYRCERNLLCEKLKPTCRAMGATCKIVGLNAICDCPQDKMYHPKSGICEDICDPWKCIYGRCEINGRTYKCICDAGYTGYQCGETIQDKVEGSYVWFAIMTSLMVLICLILIGHLCYFCRNRKSKLHTSDAFLVGCKNSGATTSEA